MSDTPYEYDVKRYEAMRKNNSHLDEYINNMKEEEQKAGKIQIPSENDDFMDEGYTPDVRELKAGKRGPKF